MKSKIFDYGMNGEGVAKIDGKVFLIENALIGEEVTFEILKDNQNYALGKANEIAVTSPNRVIPPCPYFYECGGCNLQHMNYEEQLKFKQLLVKKTLKKVAGIDVQVDNTLPSLNQFGYRNKSSFNYKDKKLGFFKFDSKEIVEIDKCLISSEQINKVLKIVKTYILEKNKLANNLKNIVIRAIDDQILVGVVVKEKIVLDGLFELLKQNFSNIGLYLIVNKRKDSVVLDGKVSHIAGIDKIEIVNFGIKYKIDLIGFQQINLDIQNKIYKEVLENIDNKSVVVNGFSGQGLLSAILSTKAKYVYGIEINAKSHNSAEKLKQVNSIKNMQNIHGDFFNEIKKIKKYNTLVLDPSKKGCGKNVMEHLKSAQKIIYISCNPIALSKDLKIIKNDYEIKKVIPFDMFPNTISVETIVVLEKK